ncbi:MAG: ComEC/Rec2 family competence protein [Spirochaetia bacterium]|nr:ComEC/Rec2 family competence protein [Spirochaetia bacterium]
MFSLSAFIGFLVVLLSIQGYYFFCTIVISVFLYLALLEFKNRKSSIYDITAYLIIGILCGTMFGIYTDHKYNRATFQESDDELDGIITGINQNTITIEIKNQNHQINKIKLARNIDASLDPFLFDRIYFSCSLWRKNNITGIYSLLEKLQGIQYTCKKGKIYYIKENFISFNNFRREIRSHVRNSLDILAKTSFARGFILNDTSNIHPVELNLFRKMGIAHLFSASGLHMGLLYTTCFLPFSYFGYKKLGLSTALVICFLYLCVLDFSIPLLRSYIFLSLYVFLKLLKRKTQGKYILYFSIIVLELIFPLSCFSPSFILSFLITMMILMYYPQLNKIILLKNKYIKEHLALTISASLGSCFLSVLLFKYYHPLSILYNLILVPFSGIYLASIFLYLIFPFFKYIIISGDYIFRQACWFHYLMVEKHTPENHILFTKLWLFTFFCLTIYFIYYSYKQKYWFLRKYYVNSYIALSFIFLSNPVFIKIPYSSTMAFPYGVIQYKDHSYYITGNISEFYKSNLKYVFLEMNFPFREIYASDNFVDILYEHKIHEKYKIKTLYNEKTTLNNENTKSSIIFLNGECYFFLSSKKSYFMLKKQSRYLNDCNNINLVHSKNFQPDKGFIKKFFSLFAPSTNVHYMHYFKWETVPEISKSRFKYD